MYSLCYLPTAGRMTLTVIKCRNLKAMDITGSSGNHLGFSSQLEAALKGAVGLKIISRRGEGHRFWFRRPDVYRQNGNSPYAFQTRM